MLSLEGLEAGYGDSKVLFGIDLAISVGEIAAFVRLSSIRERANDTHDPRRHQGQ